MIRNTPERGGWLEVVCGPMFGGKSEELIRRLRRAEIAGMRTLIVKPRIDDRYDVTHVVSHSGSRLRAVAAESSADVLGSRRATTSSASTRSSSSTTAIVAAVQMLVARGARVVAGGLDTDFRARAVRVDADAALPRRVRRQAAGRLPPLRRAGHDGRSGWSTGEPAPFAGETIQVGALDAYEARCSSCYEPGAEQGAQQRLTLSA